MSKIGKLALYHLVLAGLVATGIACHPKELNGPKEPTILGGAKVIGKDFKITKHFRVVNHKAYRTPTDLLQVKLEIQNTDDADLWCDVQVVFYDADHFELEKTNWQPVLFLKQQVTHYETTSISNRAADYVVMLREPRKGPKYIVP